MNREVFLTSQIWLQKLDQNIVDDLKLSFHFHLILSGALCCFQVENKLVFFYERESVEAAPKDPTVFKFSIELSTDPKSESAAGLFFIFDDVTYLVDHTAIILISFPKVSNDTRRPPSVFMEWPAVYLRIWNQDGTPEGIAVQKLYSAVSAMNKVLTAAHLRHPRLATINSNEKIIKTALQDPCNILSDHVDSWLHLLKKADEIVLPSLDDIDTNIVCACLSSDVTRSLKIAASLMKSTKKPSQLYDDLAVALSHSILCTEESSILCNALKERQREVEVRIGGLLDELYPPSISNACTLSKEHKVSALLI